MTKTYFVYGERITYMRILDKTVISSLDIDKHRVKSLRDLCVVAANLAVEYKPLCIANTKFKVLEVGIMYRTAGDSRTTWRPIVVSVINLDAYRQQLHNKSSNPVRTFQKFLEAELEQWYTVVYAPRFYPETKCEIAGVALRFVTHIPKAKNGYVSDFRNIIEGLAFSCLIVISILTLGKIGSWLVF